jgi:Ca-activated chloride channel homolog
MPRLLTSALVLAVIASQPSPGPIAAARQRQDQLQPNFKTESQLVVLHVAVKDRRGGYVGGLGQDAFRVSENKRPQAISFFNSQDAPVTVGLLMDSSGSMAANRRMVIAAAVAFAETMHAEDEIFILGFNENIYIPLPPDAPFTRDVPTIQKALTSAIQARGQTAIYNAVNAGLDHVGKGTSGREVLVVVSDGGDNASATPREQVLANAQASNAVIYTVALVDPMDPEADPGFLSQLAEATGGVAFRPRNIGEVAEVLQHVARDIRNMYTLGYVPAHVMPAKKEVLRRVAVEARLPSGRKLGVRTRRAYLAGMNPEEGSSVAR